MGHLPKRKGGSAGGSVRDPELFRKLYLKELGLLRAVTEARGAGREGTIDG
jgi:hypothetical protein